MHAHSYKSYFHHASALFGLAVAMTAYSGKVEGADPVYAQRNSCECLASPGDTGVIRSVSGNVFVTQATGSVPARPEMPLHAGNFVIVGPQSASTVRFGQGCDLRLRENTVLEVGPQEGLLCVAVVEQDVGAVAQSGDYLVPGLILGGWGAAAVAIGTSRDDPDDPGDPVSK